MIRMIDGECERYLKDELLMGMNMLPNFIPIKDWVFIDFVSSCWILYISKLH